MEKMLKCSDCGSTLKLNLGYSGCDWDTVAGEGSGFGYVISLDCDSCGRVYPIGHIKKYSDFSEVVDKLKCVK